MMDNKVRGVADRRMPRMARLLYRAFAAQQRAVDVVALEALLHDSNQARVEHYMDRSDTSMSITLLRTAESSPMSEELLGIMEASANATRCDFGGHKL